VTIRKTSSAFLITTYSALRLVPASFHLWALRCRLWIAFSGSQLAPNRTARVPMLAQLCNPTEIKKNGPAARPAIAPTPRAALPFNAA
jgi:hypothetical protein